MSDLRDHWQCDNCRCGLCIRAGLLPEKEHVLLDGRVCGTYRLVEKDAHCFDEDELMMRELGGKA